MRLFIAIPVSDQIRKALVDGMHEMKKLGIQGRFVPAQNFHITLAFLGEVKDAAAVKEVMASLPVEKSRLSLADFEYKSDQIRVAVKANQKVKKYVSDLRRALKTAGFAVDEAKLEPHITVVRGLKGKKPSLSAPKEDLMIDRICLMKSEEKDGKRVYKELYAVKA